MLLVISPSLEQTPPLAQAQISTIGSNVDTAPFESFAMKTRGSKVSSAKFHMKMYSLFPTLMRVEFLGVPS